jgi:hypothetical protein
VEGRIKPRAGHPAPGSADVCFLSAGPLAEVVARLSDAGVPIELGPVERAGAAGRLSSVYIRDPDGNLVEVSEVTAASAGASRGTCMDDHPPSALDLGANAAILRRRFETERGDHRNGCHREP